MLSETVLIDYTNHRGKRSWRRVNPHGILFDTTQWHPQRQWLLHAYDIDKDTHRLFAMKDIHAWKPEHDT